MKRKGKLGVILAGGYSTRTSCLGVKQKALAVVRWEGWEVPLVVHQVRMLKRYVDDVCVVVGWQKEDVKTVLDAYGEDCMFFVDSDIKGIGLVWKKIIGKYGKNYKKIVSVNCDDLHSSRDLSLVSDSGVFMVKTDNKRLIESKTCYTCNGDGTVNKVLGKNSSEVHKIMYVGTGIYVFDVGMLERCFYAEVNGEYSPDSVISQIVNRGEKMKSYCVSGWIDLGDVSVLRRKLLGYGFT